MRGLTISKSITNKDDELVSAYLKDISRYKLLTREEEVELLKDGSPAALDKLVKANLRFVISVAKQFQNKGLPLIDLINEGNIGLIEASHKYDLTKDVKFISYAVWWIRSYIMLALKNHTNTIRTPVSQTRLVSKVKQVINKYQQEHGELPSYDYIAKEANVPEEKIGEILNSIHKTVSIDTPFTTDEDAGSLVDVIENKNALKADANIIQEDSDKTLKALLNKLNNREYDTIILLYGIGVEPMSIKDISRKFAVSEERVRQFRKNAVKKLQKFKEQFNKR